MNAKRYDIRDALFEAPGPKAKRTILIATILSGIAVAVLVVLIIRQFGISGQLYAKHWSFFTRLTTWSFIGEGLLSTVEAALGAMVVAFLMGLVLMLLRISGIKPLVWIGTIVIECSRGIPTLLFIYFFLLFAPKMGISLDVYWKLALPVAISASGVVAEVLRSGVNSVPKGQREAALSLGMTRARTFVRIVFPQAFRYVIPSIIAELVIVLKDTTFAYVVNYADLMQNAKVLISNYDSLVSIYFVVALIYILINLLLNRLAVRLGQGGFSINVKAR